MLDAWQPAVEAYDGALAGGGDLAAALRAAAEAAAAGRDATVDLVARKGRASYLGERSRGPPGSRRDQHHAHPRGRRLATLP